MQSIFLILLLSVLGVLADVLIKLAIVQNCIGWLFLAAGLYASTVFGWFFVIRDMGLVSVGGLYATITMIQLAAVGVLCFGERLGTREIVGLLFGLACVLLLARFDK